MIQPSEAQPARASTKDARVAARRASRAAAVALAAVTLALATASSAWGVPVHPRESGRDISGLNHACGAALDSAGDVYVASTGEAKIKVFDPSHALLASIPNANEPCGLAVDTHGTLFVVEKATGNVVRYVPNSYPFAGAPSYGAAEPVDSSGDARGIAVDTSVIVGEVPIDGDNSLYVTKSDHIDAYGNERQRINLTSVSAGSFTLTFDGQTTSSLPYDASHAEIQTALEGLSTIGSGNVSVTTASWQASYHLVTFVHALGLADVGKIEVDASGLTGSVIQSEIQGGPLATIGSGSLDDPSGVAAFARRENLTDGDYYVFVADADKVKVFAGPGVASLKLRQEIPGPEVGESFDFGPAGTAVGVDWANGHFFVYDAGHAAVDEFEANGRYLDRIADPSLTDAAPTGIAVAPQRNEIQRLGFSASGGTFALAFEGESTPPLAHDASADQVQSALESLPSIGAGNIAVNQTSSGLNPVFHMVFTGSLGNQDVPELTADGSALVGSSSPPVVQATVPGLGPGGVFVTTGAGAGAKLLAFGPLAASSRQALGEPLSRTLEGAQAVATDSAGNVYVAAGKTIHAYRPDGTEIDIGPHGAGGAGIETLREAKDLAVDSEGHLYTMYRLAGGAPTKETVQYYTPASYPPQNGAKYNGPVEVANGNSFSSPATFAEGIAINPQNDHLFFSGGGIIELDSAAQGSAILNGCFGCGLNINSYDVGVYGRNGNVYVSEDPGGVAFVVNPQGTEILAQITGADSPMGVLPFGQSITVDQANGHLLLFGQAGEFETAEEFDASGAFVADFGTFRPSGFRGAIAIDNSGGASDGRVYVAYDSPLIGAFDLSAFGPLAYGEAPAAVTGVADQLGSGGARLNGSVDPRGFAVEACSFQYLLDSQYRQNLEEAKPAFEGSEAAPCVPGPVGIGKGIGAVAVHADLTGLDPQARYRFRLLASNKYGLGEGEAALFGLPLVESLKAQPLAYREATLRGSVDPSGLATKYRFEYGADAGYGNSTPTVTIPPGDAPVAVEAVADGLGEGTEYHFRLIAENGAGVVPGADLAFTTLSRRPSESCPNAEYRIGLSAKLADCRAYELVTPPDVGSAAKLGGTTAGSAGEIFNNWLVDPRGPGAGESVAYFTGTLPGFDGSGYTDGYRAQRAQDEGPHPAAGWTSQLESPSFAQIGVDGGAKQRGVAADQRYWLFGVGGASESSEETLEPGEYLRTPSGFEPIGRGSLGTDMEVASRFVTAGGAHVVFVSRAHLEKAAAPSPTLSIYDRAAGATQATVVSVPPPGASLETIEEFEDQDAQYIATSEDGSSVVFDVGGTLYAHRDGQTTEIAPAPSAFAGISADGSRVFYMDKTYSVGPPPPPADLYVCDLGAAPCVGEAEPLGLTQIATDAIFVNVSDDGSHAFFVSGTDLYVWDGAEARFVVTLDPQDLIGFEGSTLVNLLRWTESVSAGQGIGRNKAPTRSTPDGEVFVFQSHAQLSPYDNEGETEIYRYDEAAPAGQQILCVSCNPTDVSPGGEAAFLSFAEDGIVEDSTLIPNVSDDGGEVFFQSPDRLLPEDANSALDVYEWQADGTAGCAQANGCLALLSTGQGEGPSYLFGMSADGRDVFFQTREKLVGADAVGNPSLYDARVGGGIPDPPAPSPCRGDACQGSGAPPPVLPAPTSTGGGEAGRSKPVRCTKGKARRHKGRCVGRRGKGHKHRRAKGARRAHR
jgi:hypothetical protein